MASNSFNMKSNKLRNYILPLIVIVLLTSSKLEDKFYSASNGRVNFTSEAPLEIIKASSNKLAGILSIVDKEFVFSVKMNSFEGFNSPLQRTHFNENYIESEKFPEAKFKGKIIEDLKFNTPGTYKIRAKGKFSVHGKENPITIHCDMVISSNEIQVYSTFKILLKDYDIQIPTIVNQKLAEQITVSVKVTMKPKK